MENQRLLAAKQFIKNQAKKASDYFKPTEKVRARDVIRELPNAVAQTFSGTRDTVVKGGKILGEGLAYATSPNVRKMYHAGNTDILPTVSNTSPRQMLGTTAKSAMELLPVGKMKGLANAAMSAKLLPRVLAGGTIGYGYGVADELSRPEAVSKNTFAGPNPILAALGGALFGGMSRPTSEMFGQAGREIGDDIRNINPANRLSHKVVDKYDMEPVPGVFAPGGIQQQRPIMESFRKEVETTQLPFNPQSSLARFLMGKQKVGMGIEPVKNPLLQEARKYKSAEEFVKNNDLIFQGVGEGKQSDFLTTKIGEANAYATQRGLKGKGEIRVYRYSDLPDYMKIITKDDERYNSILEKLGPEYVDKTLTKEQFSKIQTAIGFNKNEIAKMKQVGSIAPDSTGLKSDGQLTDLYNKAQGTNKK